jgi:hypothetical protein
MVFDDPNPITQFIYALRLIADAHGDGWWLNIAYWTWWC